MTADPGNIRPDSIQSVQEKIHLLVYDAEIYSFLLKNCAKQSTIPLEVVKIIMSQPKWERMDICMELSTKKTRHRLTFEIFIPEQAAPIDRKSVV